MEFSENITRRVKLWIEHERGWHDMVMEWAENIVLDPPNSEYVSEYKKAVYELADRMEEYFTDEIMLGANGSVTEEITRTALAYVEWDDIAEKWILTQEEELGVKLDRDE